MTGIFKNRHHKEGQSFKSFNSKCTSILDDFVAPGCVFPSRNHQLHLFATREREKRCRSPLIWPIVWRLLPVRKNFLWPSTGVPVDTWKRLRWEVRNWKTEKSIYPDCCTCTGYSKILKRGELLQLNLDFLCVRFLCIIYFIHWLYILYYVWLEYDND